MDNRVIKIFHFFHKNVGIIRHCVSQIQTNESRFLSHYWTPLLCIENITPTEVFSIIIITKGIPSLQFHMKKGFPCTLKWFPILSVFEWINICRQFGISDNASSVYWWLKPCINLQKIQNNILINSSNINCERSKLWTKN